jgi:hypothetical protein
MEVYLHPAPQYIELVEDDQRKRYKSTAVKFPSSDCFIELQYRVIDNGCWAQFVV